MAGNRDKYTVEKPRILYIDMAYTLKMVRERELEQEYSSRECGGYFDHVWGVHPLADIPEKRKPAYKGFKVSIVEFSGNQTVIEGESAYYSFLKFIFPLNFLLSQIRFARYLIKLVKREQIDIVFCVDPYFSGLMGWYIKLFTKAKFAIWVCSNFDETFEATGIPAMPRLFRKRWIEKIIERRVLRAADLVIGGNQNNLEFALKNGASLDKSTIFPVGKLIHRQHIIESSLRDKDDLFITSKAKYHFIYVGRLVELKYPDDVVRAFDVICKTEPECALIMAGDGPLREELDKMAMKMGISDKVHFLGNVSQRRLANILAGCFAVLSPLTGRSLIEAALAGLPIIAYDRDWQLDFVLKNNAGVIVTFRDWQKMGETGIHLIQHPEEAKRMAISSRQTGIETCDVDKIYGHERNEFDKLLKRGEFNQNESLKK